MAVWDIRIGLLDNEAVDREKLEDILVKIFMLTTNARTAEINFEDMSYSELKKFIERTHEILNDCKSDLTDIVGADVLDKYIIF